MTSSLFPTYGMAIGIIQPYNNSVDAAYATFLQRILNPSNYNWTMTIGDYLGNDTRRLVYENVDNNFFDNTGNTGKVNLSLDLETISSPDQFLVLFVELDVIAKSGNACGFIDIIGNAVQIPPPQFSISTSPAPLEIRQGEEKILELKINSTAGNDADAKLVIQQIHPDITIEQPSEINVVATSVASSHIKVTVSDGVPAAAYTIPIDSTFSFPITFNASSLVQTLENKASTFIPLADRANGNQNSSGSNSSS